MVEMSFEGLFIRFWWLIFPIFGMLMALWGMASTERRSRRAMDLIDSYVRQGKEPPAELLKIASGADEDGGARTLLGAGGAYKETSGAAPARHEVGDTADITSGINRDKTADDQWQGHDHPVDTVHGASSVGCHCGASNAADACTLVACLPRLKQCGSQTSGSQNPTG